MLSEENIINIIRNTFPDYIGDDAAVIPAWENNSYIITKDLLVEGVHFKLDYFKAEEIAHKALHVNLSDLAAMGAKPLFVLGGVALPETFEKHNEAFIKSFINACENASILPIGGDTTRSIDRLCISITAIGIANNNNIKYRKSARVEDLICVVGDLGYAYLGLDTLERGLRFNNKFEDALLKPKALLEEGMWLGNQYSVRAMMDISDGLLIDLKKMAIESQITAELYLEKFTYDNEFDKQCASINIEPVKAMLTGGEDYSLLFTVDPNLYTELEKDFKERFGYGIKVLGKVVKKASESVIIKKNNIIQDIKLNLFSHFGEF